MGKLIFATGILDLHLRSTWWEILAVRDRSGSSSIVAEEGFVSPPVNESEQVKIHSGLRVRVKIEYIFRETRHVFWIFERVVANLPRMHMQ